MNLRPESISTRISLMTAAVMLLVLGSGEYVLYNRVEQYLRDDLENHLNDRLSYYESVVEIDDGRLEFEARSLEGSTTASDRWRIVADDGTVLWQSNWAASEPNTTTRSKSFVLGDPAGTTISGASLKPISNQQAELNPGHRITYEFAGEQYRLPVTLYVRESLIPLNQDLEKIARAFWIFAPAAILALSALLIALVRWQLAPLTRMSQQAAEINPTDTDARIGPVGSSIELVRLRASINAMVDRLGSQIEHERQFASMAAHELRTPLAHLRTAIEIALRKERTVPEYRKTLEGSLNDVLRLQRLIENLLFVVRHHESKSIETAIPLNELVAQAMRDSGAAATMSPSVSQFSLAGQRELLALALRNVLENAARYAPGEPPELNAIDSGTWLEVRVTDSGPGVQESAREKIFEPLARLDPARSIGAVPNGFGLGLTVARTAVKACGGELTCRARADGLSGAEFVFRFRKTPWH